MSCLKVALSPIYCRNYMTAFIHFLVKVMNLIQRHQIQS
jgi:hypothetical protein